MRLWKIREGFDPDEMSMNMRGEDEVEMAYEEGCKHGYKKGYGDAMKEVSGEMGYRGGMGYREGDTSRQRGSMERPSTNYGNRMMFPPYVNYRDDDDDDYMGERRRRDSRGRYM